MTNTKSTKRALLASVMALLLCFSMLLSTTFAWFTDSVTSGNNIIKSGNLDIELEYWNGTNWADVKGASDILTNTLWEPGVTEVAYLRIANAGSLALKYQFGVNILNESEGKNQKEETFKLSDYIMFGVVENVNGEINPYSTDDAGRAAAIAAVTDAKKISAGYTKAATMKAGDPALYLALVVYMPTDTNNVANHNGTDIPQIDLGINVFATQLVNESDSFGSNYDKDAIYYDALATTDAELKAAIIDPKCKVIAVKGDLTYDWGANSYENSEALYMKGKTFVGFDKNSSITFAGYGSANPITDVTLKNITVKDITVGDNESSWEHGYLEFVSLKAQNVVFADPIMLDGNSKLVNCSMINNASSWYGIWIKGGNTVIEDCTFSGTRSIKIHEAYSSDVESVVIDNCKIGALSEKPGVVIGDLDATTKVTIKNSTFVNCQEGDQGKYIYESDTDVTKINFAENNNVVIGGEEIVDGVYENGTRKYYVYTAEGLQNVFAQVIPANREQSQTVNLMADVDLTGIIWQPISNMHFTFNGNGHTISNVTCAEGWRSGFFGYAGGVKVNDLTLENVTSAGAQAGTFAGSAEGLNATNCFLKGTNTVTYVPYATETWGGIGAVTGVVASSNINVTIVEGATVTLNKSGLTTNCPYFDNLTGYLNANSGTVVNNGTVKVIDLAIATAEELFAFAKDVNKNGNTYSGKTVVLTADIDLGNAAWTPIGQTRATEFKGTFDGQGHTIKNLNVDSSAQTGKHYSSGLFGWAESGVTIQNVKIDGAKIVGNHNVAVIVGYTYSGKIINCHVTNAKIVCNHANGDACGDKCGLIVGYAGNESRITGCTATDSTVTAGRDAGQMIGCGYNVSVSNCSATNVTVTAGGDCTGANINESVIGRVM